jgi:hypothetical protein
MRDEPIFCPFDPLDSYKSNAHMLVLGPAGSGKTATLIEQILQAVKQHRPRLVIVDPDGSYGLLFAYLQNTGLSAWRVNLGTSEKQAALAPFLRAGKLLEDRQLMALLQPGASHSVRPGQSGQSDQNSHNGERDLLGEMLIAAELTLMGCEKFDQEHMPRADRWLVLNAIVAAAMRARQAGQPHPLVQDVALELMALQKDGKLSQTRRDRAEEMGQVMMAYTQGVRGALFNRPGADWPDADVILVEMGALTGDGCEDALALAYTSLIDTVQSRAERLQDSGRAQILLAGDARRFIANAPVERRLLSALKQWPQLNTWLWLGARSLSDFSGRPDLSGPVMAAALCGSFEYKVLRWANMGQIEQAMGFEQAMRFRQLGSEERGKIQSMLDSPGHGKSVLIGQQGLSLIDSNHSALSTALAMNHERHRQAAMLMAERRAAGQRRDQTSGAL